MTRHSTIELPGGLAAQRAAHAEAFLAGRNTSFTRLAEIVGKQVDDIDHLLLTSSAVQGLANATSDIDTICVIDGEDLADRTSTQFFDGGNHFETILFSRNEVARELDRLASAAAGTMAEAYAAYAAWNKHGPMTRKFLERLVNGVDVDGSSPYLEHSGPLAVLWRAWSIGQALIATECAAISSAAGKPRAAVGYGANAVLFAMDALMSHAGEVYSNKKWYALRFERFLHQGDAHLRLPDEARALQAAWAALWAAMKDGGAGVPMPVNALTALIGELDQKMSVGLGAQARWAAPGGGALTTKAFLPGQSLALAPGNKAAILVGGPTAAMPFGESAAMTPQAAADLLRAVRFGLLRPVFDADNTGDGA